MFVTLLILTYDMKENADVRISTAGKSGAQWRWEDATH